MPLRQSFVLSILSVYSRDLLSFGRDEIAWLKKCRFWKCLEGFDEKSQSRTDNDS